MKDLANIDGIHELRKRRRKTELEMKITQREFAHSMGMMNASVQDVLLKRIALPLGAAGLGYFILKKVLFKKEKPVVRITEQQVKDIKKTVNPSASVPVSNSIKKSKPKHSTSVNSKVDTKRPTVVKQRIVQQPKNTKLKKWLPVAIQLAKTGYSYYQNNIAQNSSAPNSERQQTVARNFLQPSQPSQHGNPYDRIPELRET